MEHLVNKQTIQLHINHGADAFQMQQLISEHYWNDIVPMMTGLFDEFSREDEVIRMDQLALDIGIISETEMRQPKWSDAFLSSIRQQLSELIKTGSRRGLLIIREPKGMSVCRQWLFYMEKGYLPWNTVKTDTTWHTEVLETLAVDSSSVDQLRGMIKSNHLVADRISLQYKDDFLVSLIEILSSQNQQKLPRMIEALQKIFLRINELKVIHTKIPFDKTGVWSLIIQQASECETQLNDQELIEKILIRNASLSQILNWQSDGSIKEYDIILPVFEKLRKENIRLEGKHKEKSDSDELLLVKKIQKTKVIDQFEKEGIFVQHAGVVLIHPFLSSLFKHLDITENGKFKSQELQQKAIFLLHYIATGLLKAEEYEMIMAKVLCGWPLGMPILKEIELSSEELDETDAVLHAAIKQWSALKNTSVNGLREGFLQRKGKLFSKNDQPYLKVETQSIDVLLDQLPWVLSMIKLPWMKEFLRVEWR